MNTTLIIDGMSLIFRSFYALKFLSNSKGFQTQAITGFFKEYLKLVKKYKPDCVICAFDLKKPTFRHEKYPEYKAGRRETPPELLAQIPVIKEACGYAGIKTLEREGFEADDIAGTLAAKLEGNVLIYTGDRDYLQLISENTTIILATKKEDKAYNLELLKQEYNLEPSDMIELKAIVGDKSDNIPGVVGIGDKGGLKLIQDYGNIDYIYSHIDEIDVTKSIREKLKNSCDNVFLSRELGTINLEVPLDFDYINSKQETINFPELERLLTKLEMKSTLSEIKRVLGQKNIGGENEELPLLQMEEGSAINDEEENRLNEDIETLIQASDLNEEFKNSEFYKNVEIPLEDILKEMSETGIKIDRIGLANYGEELLAAAKKTENLIYSLCGEEFNINSPKQLGEILFGKLNLKHGKKNKSGGYATDAETLKNLSDISPVIPAVLNYRTLTKLNSTFVIGLLNCATNSIDLDEDGRIHATFNRDGARTGRISCDRPNLQNIPSRTEIGRNFRKYFVPKNGYSFVVGDYSQVELRILAHLSGDISLTEAFNNDEDIHTLTASQVFDVPLPNVTGDMRTAAKAVNFGIIYGMGAFSLSKDINTSVANAKKYISNYLSHYKGVAEYMNSSVGLATKKGYSETLFGRRRSIPELSSSNKITQALGRRMAQNSAIQGTAADIIKLAMVKVYNLLKSEIPSAKLILQIHDELIIETPDEYAKEAAELLKREMENATPLNIPLTTDVRIGKSWYECK